MDETTTAPTTSGRAASASSQSKKSWHSWLPDRLTTRLRERELRREVRELNSHYEPLASAAEAEREWQKEQEILGEWAFEAQWANSELAQLESKRLRRLADRWNVVPPSSKQDRATGLWYIPDAPRTKLRREVKAARRASIQWWIQVVGISLTAIATTFSALFSWLQ